MSHAIFGAGPIEHFAGNGWVLEATAANTLQLRITGSGFYSASFVHPSGCAANSSSMSSVFRFFSLVGQTLAAPLCNEGSPVYVTIWRSGANEVGHFRCWRSTGNHNSCQRILPGS